MARRREQAIPGRGGYPAEFRDQLDPTWRDPEALAARFGDYATPTILRKVRMGGRGYGSVLNAWSLDNGFASLQWPRSADWHKLRTAGVITPRTSQPTTKPLPTTARHAANEGQNHV